MARQDGSHGFLLLDGEAAEAQEEQDSEAVEEQLL